MVIKSEQTVSYMRLTTNPSSKTFLSLFRKTFKFHSIYSNEFKQLLSAILSDLTTSDRAPTLPLLGDL